MRSKLHLTDEEILNKSWIALQLEMQDYPYYDYKSKDTPDEEPKIGGIISKLESHGLNRI
jgi:hypothetical protein